MDPLAEAQEVEGLRAELRRRLALYCEAAVQVQEWEAAGGSGAPPHTEAELRAIALGEDKKEPSPD